jgi:superfamily II DNA/RNA helicase
MNDLTFFTNEPERDLYSRFSNILRNNTQFFDVLVGYFRTSGFFKLYPAMGDTETTRILVGLNVDSKTVEIVNLSHKEAKEAFSETVEGEFNHSEDSLHVEQGVRTFVNWLRSGKIEIRMYTEAPIHAKVYIMRKDQKLDKEHYGSVITGSSNFSLAGLVNNLEFNVELKDSRDVKFALEKFEELWAKSFDIKDTYIETIEKNTWMRDDITPYELYIKTLYEYFNEEINADKEAVLGDICPDGFMRLQYQLDAVVEAEKKLEAYGGVFVSDVVGLGKTYICAMLAKKVKKGKKLFICPPVLVDYWKQVLLDFDVSARVESLGKLEKLLEEGIDDYKYVFIDEAHRFRNDDTEGFKLLHRICYGKKIILISATPINNYSSDIENQIYLFQPKHSSSIIPYTKNLEGFFRGLRGKLSKLTKGTPEYANQLRKNSDEIRDSVLRNIMVRRTRKEIMEFYTDDLRKQYLSFPKLGTPEQVVYSFNEEIDEVFNYTMRVIKGLRYARYSPLLFLKNPTKEQKSQMIAQANMGGFMKSILVKRLESSFFAFKKTLSRFVMSYQQFIDMCKTDDVYISKKVNIYDLLDSGDDDKLMQLVADDKVAHFKFAKFRDDFMPALEKDLELLSNLYTSWQSITDDPKIDEFKRELQDNDILKNKIIVFTESKETAGYLGDELQAIYGDSVIVFSGESGSALKREIEDSFNPVNAGKNNDKYRILIATDVLAEGINLHRCGVMINYDLPWNPTRIMQRVGRINRIGTKFERLYVFNFFPTSQTDRHLAIKDRIIQKLQSFHDTLGEDFKYLSDDEQVTSHKLYNDLNAEMGNEESTNPELFYLAEIRRIRDENTPLFNLIKRLPKKAKTGKYSSLTKSTATVTFLRKGYLKLFFKTEGNNAEGSGISFIEAIKFIKSTHDEPKISVGKYYYEHLEHNKTAFDNKLTEEDTIVIGRTVVTGNDAKMIKLLKALSKCQKFTEPQEDNIRNMADLWQNGEIPSALTKEILKAVNGVEDPLKAYFEIFDRIPERYFMGRGQKKTPTKGVKQIILSCYLKSKD